jgi:hypothetical protein
LAWQCLEYDDVVLEVAGLEVLLGLVDPHAARAMPAASIAPVVRKMFFMTSLSAFLVKT